MKKTKSTFFNLDTCSNIDTNSSILLAVGGGVIEGPNTRPNIEVAKLPVFSGKAEKVEGFITVCKLFLKMKMRGVTVEEQIQQVLSYMQGGSVDVWKENILEDLESGEVIELRRVEQGERTMEEFVQEFYRVAKNSRYKEKISVEEFKRRMNGVIRRKLIEAERFPLTIKQWYKQATNLDRH